MALGLPVAVTVGWQLATPATRSAAVDAPGGAGGMGDAPARHAKAAANQVSSTTVVTTPAVSTSASPSASAPAPAAPVRSGAVPSTPTGLPSVVPTEASQSPLPPLTLPPVPTPTEPDDPSASTPADDSAPPSAPAGTPDDQRHLQWAGR